jgi:hypothetical protein
VDRDERHAVLPHQIELVHSTERLAVGAPDRPTVDVRTFGRDRVCDPEAMHDAHGVDLHRDAGAGRFQLRRPLEDADVESALPERDAGGQPADPRAADDDRSSHRPGDVCDARRFRHRASP